MKSVAAISTDQFDIKLQRTDPVFAGGSIFVCTANQICSLKSGCQKATVELPEKPAARRASHTKQMVLIIHECPARLDY
jgi:hypothetical protein